MAGTGAGATSTSAPIAAGAGGGGSSSSTTTTVNAGGGRAAAGTTSSNANANGGGGSSSSGSGSSSGAPVYLNVYDLVSGVNAWTYWCGVGVFHAGVEVHGVEYAFGGHDYDVSGVFATRPREAPGALFREALLMGETRLPAQRVQQLVQQMGARYRGNRYHLLQLNCNHFASDLCEQLTGRPAPGWVNRLAGLAVLLHCLLPGSWVPPLHTPSAAPEDTEALLGGGYGSSAAAAASDGVGGARGKRRAIAARDPSRDKLLEGPPRSDAMVMEGRM